MSFTKQFGVYEWCWTSSFDPMNPNHCKMAGIIEESTGISRRRPSERLLSAAKDALHATHFQIVECADLSDVNGKPAMIPWYNVLENAIQSPHVRWPLPYAWGELSKEAAQILVQGGVYKVSKLIQTTN